MKPIRVEERRIVSFDGTEIAYHVVGEGPSILLGNGLGGSWKAWQHQIAFLSDRYRFVSWDYRGLYRSGAPAEPGSIRVDHHARDAVAILEAENIERTAMFGWSMGVQVALEVFRRVPGKLAALVLINGVPGRPWDSVADLKMMRHVVPRAIRLIRSLPAVTTELTRRVVAWPETVTWAKRIGLAGQTLDEELWHD